MNDAKFDRKINPEDLKLYDKDTPVSIKGRRARRQRKLFKWGEYNHY